MTRPQGAVTLGSERRATSGPSPYSQDLSEGLCVGDWDFPDLSQAAQWASCSQCPVRARCWAAAEEPDEIRIAKASARHRRGESWGTICADLGLSHVELWRKLTAADEDALADSLRRSHGWWRSALPEVERLSEQGLSGVEIAEQLGYEPHALRQALYRSNRHELWRSDHRPRALVYIEAIEAGSTLIEISSRFSLSAKSIESALYRAGRADLVQRAKVARVSRGNQYGRWSA